MKKAKKEGQNERELSFGMWAKNDSANNEIEGRGKNRRR